LPVLFCGTDHVENLEPEELRRFSKEDNKETHVVCHPDGAHEHYVVR
jgi:hypothetical protein